MTDLRQAAEQALEALRYTTDHLPAKTGVERYVDDAITALQIALAQPEHEPVAWGVLDDDGQIDWTAEYPFSNEPGWSDSVPLYTAPPKREWVGLTKEEFEQAVDGLEDLEDCWAQIEDKLKEKNT